MHIAPVRGAERSFITVSYTHLTQDERLTAVVVLPTPPFWFATATIFATLLASFREKDLFHMEHFEDEARRFPLSRSLIQLSIAHQRGFLNWFFIILRSF